jgi:DNA-binding transcriptional regulator LsrR (DeoR family)
VQHDVAAAYTAARLYYGDDLSQQEVAERLNVSRSTISRLLQLARDAGIVRIEVRPPSSSAELSTQLTSALGLRRAAVVAGDGRSGVRALVPAALSELERLRLEPGSVLTTSSGEALWEIAQAQRLPSLRGVVLVPGVGGMDEVDTRFQPNEIVRRIADTGGAEVRFLHVPALPSPTLRRSLVADPEIAARLALWDRLDAAIVDIEAAPRGLGAAVGNVASRHFDVDGRTVEVPEEERMLAVSRDQLRAARSVIGVAAGPNKAVAAIGAARAGLIDVLVTDAATAAGVLERVSRAE